MDTKRLVRRLGWWVAVSGLIAALASSAASGAPRAHQAQCSSPLSAERDPSNPLALADPPGSDPLHGAPFFEEGPGRNRGSASNAIAGYIGRDPFSFPSMTWDAFHQYLDARHGVFTRGQKYHIALMSKVAVVPEAHWFTVYTGGGLPGAIYTLAQQYLCRLQETDPGKVGLLTTYFLKHGGYCPTNRETPDDQAVFKRRINELIDAVGNFPVVIYFELDGIMTAGCLSHDGLLDREGLMRWAIDRLSRVPHAVVYVDGGSSDATSVGFTTGILNAIDARKIRGFFLNGTHYNWTTDEARYGDRVARRTGTHFVIDTRANGRGPLLTRDPVRQGIEELCNPPGRGLGPRPVGDPRVLSKLSKYLDGFVWTGAPGRSGGTGPGCHGVTTGSGLFDEGQALMLAKNANGMLGPGYPNEPY